MPQGEVVPAGYAVAVSAPGIYVCFRWPPSPFGGGSGFGPSAPPFYFLPSAPENEEISFLIPVSYALTPTLSQRERKFTKYFAVVLPEAIAVDSSAR